SPWTSRTGRCSARPSRKPAAFTMSMISRTSTRTPRPPAITASRPGSNPFGEETKPVLDHWTREQLRPRVFPEVLAMCDQEQHPSSFATQDGGLRQTGVLGQQAGLGA